MKKLLLLAILIFMVTSTFGCSSTKINNKTSPVTSQTSTETNQQVKKTNQTKINDVLTSNDGGLSITYSTLFWEKNLEHDVLKFKGYDSCIDIFEYNQKISDEDFIDMLNDEFNEYTIEGTRKQKNFKINDNEYPIIHLEKMDSGIHQVQETLLVMNGESKYILLFLCRKSHYEQTKSHVYDVFETLKLEQPSNKTNEDPSNENDEDKSNETKDNSNVIYDEDLANTLSVLNKAAGIDKKSAMENISADGKELIGSWGTKDASGNISARLIITSDKKYSWYKSYPKTDNVMYGEWSYPEPRLLKLKLTTAIIDGKDTTSTLTTDISYEILSFKDNTMKMSCIENQSENTYYKIDE